MNEKINLIEILKDCPEGTKLYSPIYGDVELVKVIQADEYPIQIKLDNNSTDEFTKDGRIFEDYNGECMLFPSREQRDWGKFKPKKPKQPKFDPKTLQAFDKVLARDTDTGYWQCDFFEFAKKDGAKFPYSCVSSAYNHCIPYNDDTKHLIGTTEEAPEFYRYWED